MRGHSECLAKLLEDGADVTLVGAEDTPLHMAALFNKLDCAKLLLSKEADVTARNARGKRPCQLARTEEMPQTAQERRRPQLAVPVLARRLRCCSSDRGGPS